jgi:hypothetical protein
MIYVERQPFGLTESEMDMASAKAYAHIAAGEPGGYAKALLMAIERIMVGKGDTPGPHFGLLLDKYEHLRAHAHQLSEALGELIDRAEMQGLNIETFQEVLDEFSASYPLE